MKDNNIISWIGSGITCVTGALSTNEVLQIMLTVLGIISAIVSLAFNIYVWYRNAKADGKITKEEIAEVTDIINTGVKDIKDKTGGAKDGKD